MPLVTPNLKYATCLFNIFNNIRELVLVFKLLHKCIQCMCLHIFFTNTFVEQLGPVDPWKAKKEPNLSIHVENMYLTNAELNNHKNNRKEIF